MNYLKINLTVFLILVIFAGCGKNDKTAADKKSPDQNTSIQQGTDKADKNATGEAEITEIKLPTMQCSTCKKNIESAVKKMDGIEDVNVVVKEKIAKVKYDKSKTDLNKIEGVITMAGYQANDKPANKDAYDKLEDCCKIGGHEK